MAIYLIQEPVSMLLLGVGLLSLARFGRMYFNKHSPTKTLLSVRVDKLRLRDGFKIKSKIIQKKSLETKIRIERNIICKRSS